MAGPAKRGASSIDGSAAPAARLLQAQVAGLPIEAQQAALRPPLPLMAHATPSAPALLGATAATASTGTVQRKELEPWDIQGHIQRDKCLELLAGDSSLLEVLLATSAIDEDVALLIELLEHPRAVGQYHVLMSLIKSPRVRGDDLLTLLDHPDATLFRLEGLLGSYGRGTSEQLLDVLEVAPSILAVSRVAHVQHRTLAEVRDELGRLGNWSHVELYFGPEWVYAKTKSAEWQAAHSQLLDLRDQLRREPVAEFCLSELDVIEEILRARELDPWAPAALVTMLAQTWPLTDLGRVGLIERIEKWVFDAKMYAENLRADPETHWPRDAGSPTDVPEVKQLKRALELTEDHPLEEAAKEATTYFLAMLNELAQVSLDEARTLHGRLKDGEPLDTAEYNRIVGRLALIHTPLTSPAVQADIDRVSADLAGLAAVRSEPGAQPPTARGDGYVAPTAEMSVSTEDGKKRTTADRTEVFVDEKGAAGAVAAEGAVRPSDEELREFISRRDVIQGGLADCFLSSALASIADARPSVIYDAITPAGAEGFNVRLYQPTGTSSVPGGAAPLSPISVAVDHMLPADSKGGTIRETVRQDGLWNLFGLLAPVAIRELWAVLMEKAIAKAFGTGYRELASGGMATTIFEMVTGAAASEVALAQPWVITDAEKNLLWTQLAEHVSHNRPATAGSDAERMIRTAADADVLTTFQAAYNAHTDDVTALCDPDDPRDLIRDSGFDAMRTLFQSVYDDRGRSDPLRKLIMKGIGAAAGVYAWHAYSILAVEEVHGAPGDPPTRRVLLRNPWGKRYSGAPPAGQTDSPEFWLTFDAFLDAFGSVSFGNFNAP